MTHLTKFFLCMLSVALILTLGSDASAQGIEEKPSIKIYYVPFDTETFVPITKEDIESRSYLELWIYDNEQLVAEILSLLQGEKTSKKINDEGIRLKIENVKAGTVFFVDRDGVGFTNKGGSFLLTKAQVSKLQTKIVKLRGVVHVNVDRLAKYGLEYGSDLEENVPGTKKGDRHNRKN